MVVFARSAERVDCKGALIADAVLWGGGMTEVRSGLPSADGRINAVVKVVQMKEELRIIEETEIILETA